MDLTVEDIAQIVAGTIQGDRTTVIASVASLRHAGPRDLTYAEEQFQDEVMRTDAGCVIVRTGEFPGKTVISVRNPKLAFAQAAAVLLQTEQRQPTRHPTAVIAAGASISSNVSVGPLAVIESGVVIGENSIIGAGSYVGCNSRIGAACTIYPRVVIYPDVVIGMRVTIHAGAVIGADGFGFVRDGSKYVKFPQVGGVLIEDDCEIGANTCIDRGSLETTIIRCGTKLDNLIQIAHNVEIGENTVIAAQTGISGSSTIGAQSIIGGQVGIGEHARLDPGTVLGGQAGVLNSKHVKGGEVLWGTPARPLKEFLKQQAHLVRLPKIYEELRKLRHEPKNTERK